MKSILRKLYIYFFKNQYKNRIYNRVENLSDLQKNRSFEPELLLLDKFVKQGDIVFDVGANVGDYTFKFEKLTNPTNVHAFEPIPKLFKRLNVLFPLVNLHQLALSNVKAGVSNFKIPIVEGDLFETRGKLDVDIIEPNETNHELIKIECDNIDDFVNNKKLKKVDFIKIDVEGHEFEVIKGAIETIKEYRPILLVEIEQRHHDFDIKEIFNFLNEYYSDIKFYDLHHCKFKSISEFNSEKDQLYDNLKSQDYINNFWFFK